MSSASPELSPTTEGPVSGRPAIRDWRVWLGVAITVLCLWLMVRKVPLGEVIDVMRRADLVILLTLSIPSYVLSVWLRALRWRHLTNPIQPISRGVLFRGQAIGFMVNNLVPLRIGEIVRSWWVSRESGTSGTAILGTVVLERVLDIASVLAVAVLALLLAGDESSGGVLTQGVRYILPFALAPPLFLVVLRLAPERVISLVRVLTRPLSESGSAWLERSLRSLGDGLGALSRGSHLFWIILQSVLIWLVASTIPIAAGLWAFGIELGSPTEGLVICWILLAVIGVAVAIPSTPGFFGPYQLAYLAVLEKFGVDAPTALGVGLLVWFVFWISLIVQGFVVLRLSHVSFADLTSRRSKAPSPESR